MVRRQSERLRCATRRDSSPTQITAAARSVATRTATAARGSATGRPPAAVRGRASGSAQSRVIKRYPSPTPTVRPTNYFWRKAQPLRKCTEATGMRRLVHNFAQQFHDAMDKLEAEIMVLQHADDKERARICKEVLGLD